MVSCFSKLSNASWVCNSSMVDDSILDFAITESSSVKQCTVESSSIYNSIAIYSKLTKVRLSNYMVVNDQRKPKIIGQERYK